MTGLLRGAILTGVPLALLPAQRMLLVDGGRLDPGQLLWVATGALIAVPSGRSATGVITLVIMVFLSTLCRIIVSSRGKNDAYTLISIIQWLAVPSIIAGVLDGGSAPTHPLALSQTLILVSAITAGATWITRRTGLGAWLRAMPGAFDLLRAYRVPLVRRALAVEALVACTGVAAGLLLVSALPALSSDAFGAIIPWTLASATVLSGGSWRVGVFGIAGLAGLHLLAQVAVISLGTRDLTPSIANVVAVIAVGSFAWRRTARKLRPA